jgi:hypothetical protein
LRAGPPEIAAHQPFAVALSLATKGLRALRAGCPGPLQHINHDCTQISDEGLRVVLRVGPPEIAAYQPSRSLVLGLRALCIGLRRICSTSTFTVACVGPSGTVRRAAPNFAAH